MRPHSSNPVDGSVSLWHAWRDLRGIRHTPVYWQKGAILDREDMPLFHIKSFSEALETITKNQLFVLCTDILDERDIPFTQEMLRDSVHAIPYLTRSGSIPALRLSARRTSGFLVPSSSWAWKQAPPCAQLVDNLWTIFGMFGYQASTPSSLSEKVLRSTLPEKLFISRPSMLLRESILRHHTGGRIDKAKGSRIYKCVRIYDKNKAYLCHSRLVPSPFLAPVCRFHPSVDEALSYVAGWWDCQLVARDREISPIQLKNGEYPVEGEVINKWLWSGELQDCLDAGYTCVGIRYGYGFREMSNFMEQWSDILWEKYLACAGNVHLQQIIKSMMVGLPGRFLRSPETYLLIPLQEAVPGDIPLKMHWMNGNDAMFSEFVIRPQYDEDATALSPIGSYIVAEMRRELYHMMRKERQNGNYVINSYIDSLAVSGTEPFSGQLGIERGYWKEKILYDMLAEENRLVAETEDGEAIMRAPGFDREKRIALWKRYREEQNSLGA